MTRLDLIACAFAFVALICFSQWVKTMMVDNRIVYEQSLSHTKCPTQGN